MPLDIWIARANAFDEITRASPVGPMPRDAVDAALARFDPRPAGDDDWVWLDDEPAFAVEYVDVEGPVVVRLGVSMTAPGFAERARRSLEAASVLAGDLNATAFEAAAGRALPFPTERFVRSREREAERAFERLFAANLAPLEFPIDDLDAVSNVLTWTYAGEGLEVPTGLVEAESDGRRIVRWDVTQSFIAVRAVLPQWVDRLSDVEDVTFDGRQWSDELARCILERNAELAAEFYLWWRGQRESWPSG